MIRRRDAGAARMSERVVRLRVGWAVFVCLAALGCFAVPTAASANTFSADAGSLGPIPNNTGDSRDVTFSVDGLSAEQPTSVSVTMTINHTAVGDLVVELIAPDGTTKKTIFSLTGATTPPGGGSITNLGGTYTFSDHAPSFPGWWDAAANASGSVPTIPSGTYRASNPLNGNNTTITPAFSAPVFDPNGTWTLRVTDQVGGDGGAVTAASLDLIGTVQATSASLGSIPDGSAFGDGYGSPRDVTFAVSGIPVGTAAADIALSMTVNHTFVGDLDARLIAPDGTTQRTIFSRTGAATAGAGGDNSNLSGTYRFFDNAQSTTSWWAAAQNAAGTDDTIAAGSYRASDPLTGNSAMITSAFGGLLDQNGTWTLRLRDGGVLDTGSITAASLGVVPGVDNVPPAAPTLTSTDPPSPSNSNFPRVKGTSDPNTTVRLYANGFCSDFPVATGAAAEFSGAGIAMEVPSDGDQIISAKAYDAGGNVSNCSAVPITYHEDSTSPVTPALSPIMSPANDNSPVIHGSGAEAGSTVRIYDNASCTEPTAASGSAAAFNGSGIAVPVPDDATITFAVKALDAAGNASPCSAPITYVEDSTSGTPTINGTDPASPANNNAPKLKGSGADPDATVQVYIGTACVGLSDYDGTAAQFNGAGIPLAVADNASQTLVAEAFDAAGNQSGCSSPFTYTEDSTPPAAPNLSGTDPPSGSDENSPKIKGAAEAGSAVSVFATSDCSGAPAASGSAADLGGAGLGVSVADNSTSSFTAKATDAAGNASECSGAISYAEVTPPPGPGPDLLAPQTTITSQPNATVKTKGKRASYSIAFNANEPATFKCSLDKAALAPCSSPAKGEAKKGAHTFIVVATDTAGNVDPTPATAEWKVKRKKRRH
jgi:subtilisin-like proprotein convertase family protein